jgi:hypothetical protein
MGSERVHQDNFSGNYAFNKDAGKNQDKQHSFGVPNSNTNSSLPKEIPAYSRATHDLISAKILKAAAGKYQQELPENQAAEVSNEPVSLQLQSDLGSQDTNSSEPGTIQRACAECESEQEADKSIQTKLTIGTPGDKYEQEADTMAQRVMSMDAPNANPQTIQRQGVETTDNIQQQPLSASITPLIQTSATSTKGGGNANSSIENRLSSQKSSGRPLDSQTRSFMEPRFGADFSSVRVHTDSAAVQMNQELGAQAFTHGNDVYFGEGKAPGENELTAHELTHTIQQTGGVQLKRKPQLESKNQQSANKITQTNHPIIQNKISTGIKPLIQRKTDPGQILEQLKNTPPSNITTAYQEAQINSNTAWSAQKEELQQSIPELPTPTGIPGQQAAGVNQAPAPTAKADANKEPVLPGANKEQTIPGVQPQSIPTVETAPSHPITPTYIASGNNTQSTDKTDNKPDPQLAASAQNALNSVNLNTSQVSTQASPPPTVNLNDSATNPAQLDTEQQQANQQVQQAKSQAAQDINKDHGENNIFPQPSNEILKANKQLTLAEIPGAAEGKQPTIPPEIAAQLDQSLAPHLQEKISPEQQKYLTGKNQFDQNSATAKTDADQKIQQLTEETKQKQLDSQQQAKADVQVAKQEWQTELDTAEQDYQQKAGKATTDQKSKIDAEKQKADQEAAQHLEKAEKDAEKEKQDAENKAQAKKDEGKKESGGFLGWLADKAAAFIDGIKEAVNFIYDKLREAVKFIFEQAKKLALAAIELAQKAIVGLIQGFGEILKGIVNVVFAAFPEISKRINDKINQAVNTAVQVVNTAADLLKKGVAAALDFLANTLDTLLGAIQALYNTVLDAIGAIIKGIIEIMQRLGHLIEAAKQMPSHFMGQLSEEVLGMDLSKPLAFERSAAACAQCNTPAMVQGNNTNAATASSDEAALLQKDKFTADDFTVDQVAPFDVSPELLASLKLQDSGEVEFGESNDPANSMDAIKAELIGEQVEPGQTPGNATATEQTAGSCCDDEQTAEAKLQEMMNQKPEGATGTQKQGEPAQQGDIPENMKTIGPLTVGQRARYMSHQMIEGVKQWFSANWPALLAGAVGALAVFIGANILTGGAVMAAVPPLLQVVGTVMTGVSLAGIAGHIGNYLSQGWAGEIPGAAKSLARGLAAGAVELVFALLFNAGAVIKALKGGVKGTTKAIVSSVKNTVKTTVKSIKDLGKIARTGAKTALKNGKIMLQGVKGGFAKGAKSLDDLARQLVNKLRFKKFKIRRRGPRIQLWGVINPEVLLADGRIEKVDNPRDPSTNRVINRLRKGDRYTYTDPVTGNKINGIIISGTEARNLRSASNHARTAKFEEKILTGDSKLLAHRMGTPAGDEAHHLIASSVAKNHPAAQEAAKHGWDLNHPKNGLDLPNAPGRLQTPDGRDISHRGGHTDVYYKQVQSQLDAVWAAYNRLPANRQATFNWIDEMNKASNRIRQGILNGKIRLYRN